MYPGRDIWWHDPVEGHSPVCEPVWVDSEHPLFLLYTSGSTGQAEGHPAFERGYLLGAKLTSKWVFDINDEDIFWCTADIGWVTGHSYVAYGPLAAGRHRRASTKARPLPASGAASGRSSNRRASRSSTRRPPRSAR
jgi:acetyl-CoA synthetase